MVSVNVMEETLADLLKRRRAEMGISQAKLAEAAQITPAYVGQMELGQVRMPSPNVMRRLADALKVRIDDLVRSTGYDVGGLAEGNREEERRRRDIFALLMEKHHGDRAAARRELIELLQMLKD